MSLRMVQTTPAISALPGGAAGACRARAGGPRDRATPALRGGGGAPAEIQPEALADSYRRLAEVFHEVMSEQSLDALLDRIAVTLADLMPYEALHIYEA